MKPKRIITATSEGDQPDDDPIISFGPETGDIEPRSAVQPPVSMRSAVLDIAGDALGEDFDQIDPNTAWLPGRQAVAPQGPRHDLTYIRSLFPFMQIMPFPTDVVSVVCTNALQAYDLNLVDGTIIVNLDADGTDWYISNYGRAQVPAITIGDNAGQSMVHPPNNVFFYTGSLRQLSVLSATAGRIVQARCWITPVRMKPNVRIGPQET